MLVIGVVDSIGGIISVDSIDGIIVGAILLQIIHYHLDVFYY